MLQDLTKILEDDRMCNSICRALDMCCRRWGTDKASYMLLHGGSIDRERILGHKAIDLIATEYLTLA